MSPSSLGSIFCRSTCDSREPPTPTVAPVTVGVWVVSLENVPRLRERFALLDASGRAPGDTTLDVHGADHDGDGHEDLLLDVGVTLADGTGAHASLPFLDRIAGLSRAS